MYNYTLFYRCLCIFIEDIDYICTNYIKWRFFKSGTFGAETCTKSLFMGVLGTFVVFTDFFGIFTHTLVCKDFYIMMTWILTEYGYRRCTEVRSCHKNCGK